MSQPPHCYFYDGLLQEINLLKSPFRSLRIFGRAGLRLKDELPLWTPIDLLSFTVCQPLSPKLYNAKTVPTGKTPKNVCASSRIEKI